MLHVFYTGYSENIVGNDRTGLACTMQSSGITFHHLAFWELMFCCIIRIVRLIQETLAGFFSVISEFVRLFEVSGSGLFTHHPPSFSQHCCKHARLCRDLQVRILIHGSFLLVWWNVVFTLRLRSNMVCVPNSLCYSFPGGVRGCDLGTRVAKRNTLKAANVSWVIIYAFSRV